MTTQERPKILSYIIPTYDEITLFAMGFTCALLMITGAFTITWNWHQSLSKEDVNVIILASFFLAGLILSIYHAFTSRKKTYFEKFLMLFFAVVLNASIGIVAGSRELENVHGWLVIFPVINIVNGALLLILLRTRVINDDNISDENTSLSQVSLSGSMIIILFVVCHYLFDFFWMQTFSICVVYSTNINRGVQTVFARYMPSRTAP